MEHADIPLRTRIIWAIEIAQGLAHLHTNKVVWADAHFRNILMTDDLHVVLCDFASSVINPDILWWCSSSPPRVFTCPMGYYGCPSTYLDIFGFGVMLFALLSNRFPHCQNLHPHAEEQDASHLKHCDKIYDKLPDPLDRYFGHIVADGFNVRFPSAVDLVEPLERAYRCWIDDQPKVCVFSLIACERLSVHLGLRSSQSHLSSRYRAHIDRIIVDVNFLIARVQCNSTEPYHTDR